MAIKTYKPTTPSRRYITGSSFDELTKEKPEKSLLEPLKRTGGRNSYGRITSRHRGGGHKRLYRKIDFLRHDRLNTAAKVLSIEYDPNRSGRIALIEYPDKEKRYILWPDGLKVGAEVQCGIDVEIKHGNCLPLSNIPLGTPIHNIEMRPGRGGAIVRSAGVAATIMAKEGSYAHIKLPSQEVRLVNLNCYATIGQVGNVEHSSITLGKAGRSRWLGRRPHVRGVAMNPHDHPHGGGEGKSGQGNPHPVSPWGMPTKGFKTRKKNKWSNRFIVKRRR